MPTSRPLGQYLVDLLVANGVDTVFGIPGVHTLELYRGLVGARVRHVLTRHEQGAAFAADGYARISGRPAACFLISGPGLANAMTAIGQAYTDSVPMIVVSSVAASDTLGKERGVLHEMTDQRAMAATVTAFSTTCLTAEDVRDALHRAFALFAAGRPRPVHIEVPIDRLTVPTDLEPVRFPRVHGRPSPGTEAISAVVAALEQAHRPFIIIGGGAIGGGEAAARLATALGAPVATTVAAKGAVPEDHPLAVGAGLQYPQVHARLAEADVVLAVGTELGETDSYVDTLRITGTLIRVDIDPVKLSDRYQAAIPVLADGAAALEAFAARIGGERTAWCDVGALRASVVRDLDEKTRRHRAVLSAVRRALPPDGAIATDMTQIAYSGNGLFPAGAIRSWFHPSGFGTLGYALPAAIGAKLAAPERPVLALAGDYGFQFTLQDLGTAAEERLCLPILVWNNDRLGQIRDDMVASGIQEIGVSLKNPSFALLAAAYGIAYEAPGGLADVEEAIRVALGRNGPTLIEIREAGIPID